MGKKYKLPLTVGFAALCDHIKAIKKTADQSGSAVTELAVAVDTTVAEIDNVKAGKDQLHWYGTCTTAAATAAKVVTLSGTDDFDLRPGASVTFKCSYTNTASNPTLNVNGTGAKPVWYASAAVTTGNLGQVTYANRYVTYVYDGTYWVWQSWGSDNNTTYSNASLGQGYGTCTTAAATAAKVVTLSSYALTTGGIVAVKFTYAVPASATMNINSKGAKAIYYQGAAISDGVIAAGDVATFVYDGTRYQLMAIDRLPPDAGTTAPAAAGTAAAGTSKAYARADHVHPAQTSVSGNAGSATKLATARTIGLSGVTATAQSFNGTANITIPVTAVPASIVTGLATVAKSGAYSDLSGTPGEATESASGLMPAKSMAKLDNTNIAYATCGTAAATAAKAATITGNDNWELKAGAVVVIKFTYTNTAGNPTLNVNGTGAKSIWYNTALITASNLSYAGYANRYIEYLYDGTNWVFMGWCIDNNTTYSNASLGQGCGTCATAAATAAKVVTLSGYALTTGGLVAVKFTNANTASNPTLNINSKGAKAIYYKGAALTDTTLIQAGDTCLFVYNGSYYHLLAIDRDADAVEDIRAALKGKQNVNPAVAFTIPATGWSTDSSVSGYTKCYDVTVEGLLDTDVVAVDVAPASENVARAANFTQTQSYAGKFRLRAEKVPTAAITAQYRVINTVAYKEGT